MEREKVGEKTMREIVNLNQDWHFTGQDGKEISVNVPHTWNNFDGQDGGNDYYRGTCHYRKNFAKPAFQAGEDRIYL